MLRLILKGADFLSDRHVKIPNVDLSDVTEVKKTSTSMKMLDFKR